MYKRLAGSDASVLGCGSKRFRNYEDSVFQGRVEQTYYEMQTRQTVTFVSAIKTSRQDYPKSPSVWSVMMRLNAVVDDSDPDNDVPQIFHAYQTAESLKVRYFTEAGGLKSIPIRSVFSAQEWRELPQDKRERYLDQNFDTFYSLKSWGWLPVIGFIHDMGKVLMFKDFGGLPQWATVGDTFPVGCPFEEANVFYGKGFYRDNPDFSSDQYQAPLGCYKAHQGFLSMRMSYGHDDYMADVLQRSEVALDPDEKAAACYLIRFHSFYPWHTPRNGRRGYTDYANDYDWKMLPLLKMFQKSDLYSKGNPLPAPSVLEPRYQQRVEVLFPRGLRWLKVHNPLNETPNPKRDRKREDVLCD